MNDPNADRDFDQKVENSTPPHPFDIVGEGAVKITVKLDYVDPETGDEFYGAFAEWRSFGYVEIEFDKPGRPSDEAIRASLRQEYDEQEPFDL